MSVNSSIRLGSGGGGGGTATGFFATGLEGDAAEEAGCAIVANTSAVVALLTLAELLMVLVTEAVMGATVGDSVATVVEVGVTPGVAVTTDVTPEAASFAALAAIGGALLVLAVAAGGVRLEPAIATPGLLAELAAAAGVTPEPAGPPVSLFRSAMFLVSSVTRVDASLA